MRDYKTKSSGEKKSVNYHSRLVARDKHYKDLQHIQVRKKEDNDEGKKWYNDGVAFDDVPEELRNNVAFKEGFFGEENRQKKINQDAYDMGKFKYEQGVPFDNLPLIYQNSEYFMMGYNDAKNSGRRR